MQMGEVKMGRKRSAEILPKKVGSAVPKKWQQIEAVGRQFGLDNLASFLPIKLLSPFVLFIL